VGQYHWADRLSVTSRTFSDDLIGQARRCLLLRTIHGRLFVADDDARVRVAFAVNAHRPSPGLVERDFSFRTDPWMRMLLPFALAFIVWGI